MSKEAIMEYDYNGICPDTGLPYAGIRSGGQGRLLGRGQGYGPLRLLGRGQGYSPLRIQTNDVCPDTGLPYAGIKSGGQGRLLGRGQGYGPLRFQAKYKLPKEVIETYSLLGTLPLEGLEWWSWEDINKWVGGASGAVKEGGSIWDRLFGGGGGTSPPDSSSPYYPPGYPPPKAFPTGLVIGGLALATGFGLLLFAITRTPKGKK